MTEIRLRGWAWLLGVDLVYKQDDLFTSVIYEARIWDAKDNRVETTGSHPFLTLRAALRKMKA